MNFQVITAIFGISATIFLSFMTVASLMKNFSIREKVKIRKDISPEEYRLLKYKRWTDC